ncbi:MAG TPA: type IV pilus modification protein PilV [Steroidobacteraceae bacterium]
MQLIERSKSPGLGRARSSGFTLLEVMIAVVITAIGLLGIAKIQALAYASTSSASARSLVASQAAGLAASMHANRSYWSTGTAPSPLTISTSTTGTTTTTTINDIGLQGTSTSCKMVGTVVTNCTPATLAAFDLHTWGNALGNMLPNSNVLTTIVCGNIPVTCTITVSWSEKQVAVNTQAAATTSTTFNPTYILYVEP